MCVVCFALVSVSGKKESFFACFSRLIGYSNVIDASLLPTLPPQVRVLCHDCGRESDTPFHVVGLKCRAPLEEEGQASMQVF